MYGCYVETIQGDVYVLVHDAMMDDRDMGFWVLHSGSKQWHSLPDPPTLLNSDSDSDFYLNDVRFSDWRCFVWKGKLLLEVDKLFSENTMFIYYEYDPQNGSWEQLKLPLYSCFHDYDTAIIVAVKSIGEVGNCTVAIAWSTEETRSAYTFFSCESEDTCFVGR
ncbi:hypothetical protein PIB30_048922 [Stylosanthes scabra]|uniref:F-box/kelch-repeat protein n=1 Tax=Stylosanthes scabra TaxID=79078 RepID=A0ABU6WH30_9FABA|nr:hypothetical protein [Stylosanthes scabra]